MLTLLLDSALRPRFVFKTFWGVCLAADLFLSGCGSSNSATPAPGAVVSTATLTLSPAAEVPPVAVPSSASGSAVVTLNQTARTLSVEQVSSFLAGACYLNIHTQANPAGELRAQVVFPR